MAELGQTDDPVQLIPGSVGAIDDNVVAIRGRGQAMEKAASGLKKIDSGAWIGDAGDAFRDQFSYEPDRWLEAADAFEATADALSDYATTLHWAQGQAAGAIQLWNQGQTATKQAKDAHDRAVADAEAQRTAGQSAMVPPFSDPGEAKRQAARDTLSEARQQLSEAGNRAAKVIRDEGDKAPEQSKWDAFWGGVGDFFGGVKDGAVQMVTGLGALIGRDPTTGEWSWETAGAAWKGMGTFALAVGMHIIPGGALLDQTVGLPGFERGQLSNTLVNAGKSIIAYDQWGEDPARAAGTAAFNIVSAIVGTKGGSAALRAGLRGKRGAPPAGVRPGTGPPWPVAEGIRGSARGKSLNPPHSRHTVGGAKHGQVKEENSVILRGTEQAVRDDVGKIAAGDARWNPQTQRYETNGRSYGVEESGTVFPDSGPGIAKLDRNEYAALKEIAKADGDPDKVPAFSKDPRFTNNPQAVAKAKAIYDGTYPS